MATLTSVQQSCCSRSQQDMRRSVAVFLSWQAGWKIKNLSRQLRSGLFTSVAMTPLKDSGKTIFPCSPSLPIVHLGREICSNWSSCKDSSIVLQKILPDSFYNSWGWLEGVKISIIDNLGEVIYTCHKSHVEFENSTYMFTFLEYRILEIKFRIIASLKSSNSGNAWHEVLENPIIGCHHNFLRNLSAEFLPSLPPLTNYLMIIIILIIFIIPMWLSLSGKKEMIKTCQLVFSLPFLASLLPQVDHGHRGSPCYC